MCRALYFLVLLICILRTEGEIEGDTCKVNGGSGRCKNIMDCPQAILDLRNKINPQICSFTGTLPIVCCADPAPAPVPATTTTTQRPPVATTDRPKAPSTTEYTPEYNDYVLVNEVHECPPLELNMTALKVGQKAWDKCVEYQEQYVFPCQESVALTGGRVRVNNCKHNANKLIINGIDAKEGEFPHMALLGYGDESAITFQCGGSIVSESFILTAGHCTYAKGFGPVTFALVGTLQRSDRYDRNYLYGVRNIHKHLGYAPPVRYNDIALLETDRRIKLNAFVVPACLDTGRQSADEALATGWGALANGSLADVLQKVKLFKFSDEECTQKIQPSRLLRAGVDSKTQVCYGDKQQSKDTCQGDSGGPLQILSDQIKCMYVLVGVTSFGHKCGVVGEPGVYIRVRHYLSWIEDVVWP